MNGCTELQLRRPIKGFNHTQTSNVANISSVTRDENGKLQVMNPNVAPTITIRKGIEPSLK